MKRITFVFLLAVLSLGNFSCADHPIPPVLPKIETLPFEFIATRAAEGRILPIYWSVMFEELGDVGITEYGIAYSTNINPETDINRDPKVGATLTTLIPFRATIFADVSLSQAKDIQDFDKIFYRAYAKLDNGDIIYGRILSNED